MAAGDAEKKTASASPTSAMDSGGERKSLKARTVALVAAAAALLGGVTALMGNAEKLAAPLSSLGLFVGQRGAAAALHRESITNRLGAAALARVHPDRAACFSRAIPIDLDGDGVKADLAVVFKRTPKPGNCKDLDAPDDVAFFASAWNGLRYLGDPELPAAITAWNFAGPAAFREQADSSYPVIHVYMRQGDKIAEVGSIDTVTSGDYTGSQYIEANDGRSAWVVTGASISKVSRGAAGQPVIERLDGKKLVAENQGLHLLAFDGEGHLSFDGDATLVHPDYTVDRKPDAAAPDPANPSDGDRFLIELAPGYHLYLVGCSPESGLTPVAAEPGAFAIDFGKAPLARCPLGEDTRFFVAIQQKGY